MLKMSSLFAKSLSFLLIIVLCVLLISVPISATPVNHVNESFAAANNTFLVN